MLTINTLHKSLDVVVIFFNLLLFSVMQHFPTFHDISKISLDLAKIKCCGMEAAA